ncbi:virulence factor SrfB [Aureimonas psammosilenae]|uniref:virulence factor SrfB n=1 Tax=Aureimonas psammosilenae TaxID=2495496 RepID=UPI00126072B3|nr:virulence factor SrfB [Aureimonas psammosilenae]
MTEPAEIVLVPHSGIQFVTIPFDVERIGRFDRPFIERRIEGEEIDGRAVWRLLPAWNESNPGEDHPHGSENDDREYSVGKAKALDPFLNEWVPLPYLRLRRGRDQKGQELYDKGPTNWARVRVVKAPACAQPDAPSHLAVFAFDTGLEAENDEERAASGAPYTTPTVGDAGNSQEFRLVSRIATNGWFLSDPQPREGHVEDFQTWVLAWVEKLFIDQRKRDLGRALREDDLRNALEHAARWFAFVGLLDAGCQAPRVRFVDTVTDQASIRPVLVDLVLDIGNSRTCGLLVENYPNEDAVDLNNSAILRLRDLARPELVHGEPFDSHVEFSQAHFGPEDLSRRSGRARAFFWPSLVRVGPEAGRLRSVKGGTAAVGGMSSPKRYLWDIASVNQPWRFPRADYAADGTAPPISRIARPYLNRFGDVISQVRKDKRLYSRLHGRKAGADLDKGSPSLSYSRSSLYGLMLAEIVWQAFVSINNPQVRAGRKQSGAPRRLRRIILTLPSALPTQEQRLMKSRAEGAVALLWDLMGWSGGGAIRMQRPLVEVSWDEATCVQLVWLYSEIARKFGGRIRDYFELAGQTRPRFEPNAQPRADAKPEPSLRVASIDIGGGTTDLMITTYFQDDDRALVPVQTFREGIGVAGDDVVRAVIERCVLPAIGDALRERGQRDIRALLNELFGGDRSDMAEQVKDRRREIVLKVLTPAALAIMALYEVSGAERYESVTTRPLDELVPALAAMDDMDLSYVTDALRARGTDGFDLRAVSVPLDFNRVRGAIRETLGPSLACLAEAVAHFDCDRLLLSGRPSRLPAIEEFMLDHLAVTPDRLQPLHRYRVDVWYPFRSRDSMTIGDPKTTAAVGAMLCALAEGTLVNFMLQTNRLQLRSTARYVGELGSDGILAEDRVLFTADDLTRRDGTSSAKRMRVHAASRIGYRQLRHARWITSPLYRLRMNENSASIPKPIEVVVGREVEIEATEDRAALLDQEASKEELAVIEATDANGADVRPSMSLSFCTMPLDDRSSEYWLESGTLTVL